MSASTVQDSCACPKEENAIAVEIWEHARASDEDTPTPER
jgi:hypothetical protein